MTSSKKRNNRSRRLPREERRITVRGIRRDPPDVRKFSKALIGVAMAEAQREAQAQQEGRAAEAPVASPDEHDGRGEPDA
jgi:hypothetical protein